MVFIFYHGHSDVVCLSSIQLSVGLPHYLRYSHYLIEITYSSSGIITSPLPLPLRLHCPLDLRHHANNCCYKSVLSHAHVKDHLSTHLHRPWMHYIAYDSSVQLVPLPPKWLLLYLQDQVQALHLLRLVYLVLRSYSLTPHVNHSQRKD